MAMTMERSYLVQRLSKPRAVDSPFAFGGGYKNGGLSDNAMDIIRTIWSFDYMGAAEFEFGAVPKALQRMAENAHNLRADTLEIPLNEVEADFRDKRGSLASDATSAVYIIAHKDHMDEVKDRIRAWAREQYNRDLKEMTRLASSLRPYHEWDDEIRGWLELDNGFMFFVDREMWQKSAKLFGVETA
jgi:hypothetical protein